MDRHHRGMLVSEGLLGEFALTFPPKPAMSLDQTRVHPIVLSRRSWRERQQAQQWTIRKH
jgi:hypothetical protein